MSRAKLFEVESAAYAVYGGEFEPPEYTVDWLVVRATSRKRAKVLAVRALRRRGAKSMDPWYIADNPFAALKVKPVVCRCGAHPESLSHFDHCPVERAFWDAEEAAFNAEQSRESSCSLAGSGSVGRVWGNEVEGAA